MTASRLIKDQTIHDVLAKLGTRFGEGVFDIVDHWDGDLFAVGIARPDNHAALAYISCYGMHEDHYDVELELPTRTGSDYPLKRLQYIRH